MTDLKVDSHNLGIIRLNFCKADNLLSSPKSFSSSWSFKMLIRSPHICLSWLAFNSSYQCENERARLAILKSPWSMLRYLSPPFSTGTLTRLHVFCLLLLPISWPRNPTESFIAIEAREDGVADSAFTILFLWCAKSFKATAFKLYTLRCCDECSLFIYAPS